jgi:hypothetical protein
VTGEEAVRAADLQHCFFLLVYFEPVVQSQPMAKVTSFLSPTGLMGKSSYIRTTNSRRSVRTVPGDS